MANAIPHGTAPNQLSALIKGSVTQTSPVLDIRSSVFALMLLLEMPFGYLTSNLSCICILVF